MQKLPDNAKIIEITRDTIEHCWGDIKDIILRYPEYIYPYGKQTQNPDMGKADAFLYGDPETFYGVYLYYPKEICHTSKIRNEKNPFSRTSRLKNTLHTTS